MSEMAPFFKKMALNACHFKTNSYLCKKERKIMAIEIKAIPTLEGKDAERFIDNPYKWDESFHVNSSTRTSESPNVTNSRRRHSTACYFFYCVKKTS